MAAKLRQLALGVAYDFKPPRHLALPHLAWRLARHTFASRSERGRLPEASAALPGREGVAGYCDDMSVSTLRAAYLQGLYPCTHWGPVRWQSPPLRAVLAIGELKLRDELRRKLRKRPFVVTFDTAPRAVMLACAQPRSGQWPLTWITADVVDAYMAAFDEGMVHSVEVWDGDGRLIGGLFGTVAGTCFVLESLFHTANNASKYGLAVLLGHLHAWGFTHVDNKLQNAHTESLGFKEVTRSAYVGLLRNAAELPPPRAGAVHWSLDSTIDLGRWLPANGPPPAAR